MFIIPKPCATFLYRRNVARSTLRQVKFPVRVGLKNRPVIRIGHIINYGIYENYLKEKCLY